MRRLPAWWMIPLLLLVTGLAAYNLSIDAMWLDEWWTYTTATGQPHYEPIGIEQIIEQAADEGYHPPTQYLLLAGWATLVGWTLPAARTLWMFLGLLAIAWTYRLGHDLAKHTALDPVLVGIGSAAALGGSAFMVNYLHDVRNYTYLALFTCICLWAYWHILTARRLTPGNQIGFFIGLVGMLYAHYAAVLIAAALGLYHLLLVPRSGRWWRIAVIGLLAGLTFLPWIATSLSTTDQFTDDVVRQALALEPGPMVNAMLTQFSNGNILLLLLVSWFTFTLRQRATVFVGFMIASGLILGFIANHFLGFIAHPRYLIGFWPLLGLVVGIGAARLAQRYGLSPLLLLGLWLVAGIGLSISPEYREEVNGGAFWHLPWDQYDAALRPHAQPGDVALMQLPDVVWRWMHGPIADFYMHDLPGERALIESLPGMDDDTFDAQVRDAVTGARRVWFGYDPHQESLHKGRVESVLAEQFKPCITPLDSDEFYLSLYVNPERVIYSANFDNRIDLALLEPLPAQAKEQLDLLLAWSIAEDVPPHTYSVGLHVMNAKDQLVAQADKGLPVGSWACQLLSINLSELPSDHYTLLATVYAWENGERLTGHHLTTDEQGERVPLGSFAITE